MSHILKGQLMGKLTHSKGKEVISLDKIYFK